MAGSVSTRPRQEADFRSRGPGPPRSAVSEARELTLVARSCSPRKAASRRAKDELNPHEMANADLKQAVTNLAPARTKLRLFKAAARHLCSVQ